MAKTAKSETNEESIDTAPTPSDAQPDVIEEVKRTPRSAKSAIKRFLVLQNVLGENPEALAEDAPRMVKRMQPHKLYSKGDIIELNEKDAKRLLAIKAVEPAK